MSTSDKVAKWGGLLLSLVVAVATAVAFLVQGVASTSDLEGVQNACALKSDVAALRLELETVETQIEDVETDLEKHAGREGHEKLQTTVALLKQAMDNVQKSLGRFESTTSSLGSRVEELIKLLPKD